MAAVVATQQQLRRKANVVKSDDTSGMYSSYDRREEWQQCCARAMGFEWVDHFDNENDHNNPNISTDMSFIEEEADEQRDSPPPIQQVINLIDDDDEDDEYFGSSNGDNDQHQEDDEEEDTWMQNANRIQSDVYRMTNWIQRKQYEFVSVDMNDEEASLIQSTVTTFLAATATDLETLRNMISTPQSSSSGTPNAGSSGGGTDGGNNMASHRAGIVQILLEQLKEQLAEPFNKLQKQRTRVAVQLWQNPLQCKLYQPKKSKAVTFNTTAETSVMQQMFDDDDDYGEDEDVVIQREQKFLPKQGGQSSPAPAYNFDDNFLESYSISTSTGNRKNKNGHHQLPRRPDFVSQLLENREKFKKRRIMEQEDEIEQEFNSVDVTSQLQQPSPPSQTKPEMKMPYQQQQKQHRVNLSSSPPPQQQEDYERQRQEELRQEAVLLQMKTNSDLESVQKVEQRMVEITTLISQFSNLVSEQQDDIIQIHDTAQTAKDNIEKGQENLIDATERTKQSKHYMAWSIVAMTMVLLFFHTFKY